MSETSNKHWSSNYLFLLASIGSTVGLSNIWKFTYLAGENGGGAFVLVYLFSLIVMGVPILAAEMMIGRRGGKSMVGTLRELGIKDGISKRWTIFGWTAMVVVFVILSFYCVITGWTLDYTILSLSGSLNHLDAIQASGIYQSLLNNPVRMAVGSAAIVLVTTWIVALGVQGGLERSIRWMMPTLFILLVALVFYAMFFGEFLAGLKFLFMPDFSKITPQVILAAFGQAFFSLGVGTGVMLTYGAYMPRHVPVFRSAVIIAFSDGLASIMAGLAIFPIVFKYGLSPAEGPGLIFLTLPIAFGEIPGSGYVGSLFFILLLFAALTSAISLMESVISTLEEALPVNRKKMTIRAGFILWVLGLITVFSFNWWSDVKPLSMITGFEDKNLFNLIDYFCSNLLMPVGGVLMTVIGGWSLSAGATKTEMTGTPEAVYRLWHFLIRFICPVIVILILLSGI
jgi:NSS family neurotransmitter:Na+ symporter